MTINGHTVCILAVTSACVVSQRDVSKLTAEIEDTKQLINGLRDRAVFARQRQLLGSFTRSIQPYPSVCSASSSKQISAPCHSCQAKSVSSVSEKILWRKESTAVQSSSCLRTKPFSLCISDASSLFPFSVSPSVDSTTLLSLYQTLAF